MGSIIQNIPPLGPNSEIALPPFPTEKTDDSFFSQLSPFARSRWVAEMKNARGKTWEESKSAPLMMPPKIRGTPQVPISGRRKITLVAELSSGGKLGAILSKASSAPTHNDWSNRSVSVESTEKEGKFMVEVDIDISEMMKDPDAPWSAWVRPGTFDDLYGPAIEVLWGKRKREKDAGEMEKKAIREKAEKEKNMISWEPPQKLEDKKNNNHSTGKIDPPPLPGLSNLPALPPDAPKPESVDISKLLSGNSLSGNSLVDMALMALGKHPSQIEEKVDPRRRDSPRRREPSGKRREPSGKRREPSANEDNNRHAKDERPRLDSRRRRLLDEPLPAARRMSRGRRGEKRQSPQQKPISRGRSRSVRKIMPVKSKRRSPPKKSKSPEKKRRSPPKKSKSPEKKIRKKSPRKMSSSVEKKVRKKSVQKKSLSVEKKKKTRQKTPEKSSSVEKKTRRKSASPEKKVRKKSVRKMSSSVEKKVQKKSVRKMSSSVEKKKIPKSTRKTSPSPKKKIKSVRKKSSSVEKKKRRKSPEEASESPKKKKKNRLKSPEEESES